MYDQAIDALILVLRDQTSELNRAVQQASIVRTYSQRIEAQNRIYHARDQVAKTQAAIKVLQSLHTNNEESVT